MEARLFAVATLVFATVLRLLPHPPNFAPLGAAVVLTGRTLPLPQAAALLLLSALSADWALAQLHGHALFSAATPFVYAGFGLQLLLGRALRGRHGSSFAAGRWGGFAAAGGGALAFFLVSNFGVWLSGLYGLTTSGLLACYVAALPFFPATLCGDVLWMGAFLALQAGFAQRARLQPTPLAAKP